MLVSPVISNNVHQSMNFHYELLLCNITKYTKSFTNFLLMLFLNTLWNHQRARRFPEIIMQSECLLTWHIQREHWREILYIFWISAVLVIDLCIWSIMCKVISSWEGLTWVCRILSFIVYLACNTFFFVKTCIVSGFCCKTSTHIRNNLLIAGQFQEEMDS